MTESFSSRRQPIPYWRFLLPLVAQVLIVAAVPIPKAITLATGRTVYLKTAPVDPYDLLRGRYVTLNYEIAQSANLKKLPGWSQELDTYGQELFVMLDPPKNQPTDPWQAVAVSKTYPPSVKPEQIVIKGRSNYGRVDYGLGAYYFDEQIGDELEKDFRADPANNRVEVKIDPKGNSALVTIWVKDRRY